MFKSEVNSPISVDASVIDRVTFASQQNDVAIIADLVIHNTGTECIENLELRLTCDPPLIGRKTWKIDRLMPASELRIKDRKVSLSGGLLADLNERLHADFHLGLFKEDGIVAEYSQRLTGLARNEWGGAAYMPELLAAFVMPNDPTIDSILKQAGEMLRSAGENPAIDGYQSRSRTRVWQLAAAIWSAVCSHRIVYATPPASFEREGQKIRSPGVIWESGLATCLDTATLFAAALEQAGLYPIIAMTEGHAICGAWLQPQNLQALTTDDASELRKYVTLNELVLFETTLATSEPPSTFSQAIAEGVRCISEAEEEKFVYALDIKQARSRQISPLSVAGKISSGDGAEQPRMILGIETAPSLPAFDLGLENGPAPDSPQTRLDYWKRKLLDLTKRNRLLNLQHSKTAIRMVCPDPAALEDRLAEGKKITLIPMASIGSRDNELLQGRTGEDFVERFAAEALERNELVADLNENDLRAGLVELYRKARTDLQEGGANTLFLALGMLRWKQSEDEKRFYRAPLLLVPITLERTSAASKIKLTLHEDEPVFNMTLLEMLRQDFDLRVPLLEGELPTDDAGVDVRRVWEIMRRATRDMKNFEVVEEIVLSTFSFAKFLMWKDLSDRTEALKVSPFVRHLIERPIEKYPNSTDFLLPHQIDAEINPGDLFMPLAADSSQIVAVHASSQKGDFVLEGPPGTGKSQTISNMIAHNLGLGRKILFVSEKMAALKVVHERLRKNGLGDFCLELHSNKAGKKEVLEQLGRSWRNRETRSVQEWHDETLRLASIRNELNQLVSALHKTGLTGISPRSAIGTAVRYKDKYRLTLDWEGGIDADRAKDTEGLKRLTDSAKALGQTFSLLEKADFDALENVLQSEWSFAWQGNLVEAAKNLGNAVPAIEPTATGFVNNIGMTDANLSSFMYLTALDELADCLLVSAHESLAFALSPDATKVFDALDQASKLLIAYREAKAGLSVSYTDKQIAAAPVAASKAALDKSITSRWPVNILRMRTLEKNHCKTLGLTGKITIERDLPILELLQDIVAQLEAVKITFGPDTPWKDHETNLDVFHSVLSSAKKLRAAVARTSNDAQTLISNRAAIRQLVTEGRELLQPGMALEVKIQQYRKAFQHSNEQLSNFKNLSCADTNIPDNIDALIRTTKAIVDAQPRINVWCRWQAASREAQNLGIGALISGLKNGIFQGNEAQDAFRAAYCTWLAPRLIDARKELSQFSALSHEDKIREFRELDAKVAQLSVDAIRARLSQGIPRASEGERLTGYSVLSRELQKKARYKPVRELVDGMGDALTALTPCLMMSPLSVAQFLAADNQLFDLVIFDEASQITVWDAVGAIARGQNVIVVGDPKQMPPTSFFDRSASANDNDENMDVEDLESILDEALASGVKLHRLTGHYRSRHESLITFSNHRYYGGELITYPSAETKQSAVSFVNAGGLYQRGRGRTNPIEAKAVVAEILRRLSDSEKQHQTLGVVALNSEQQKLIADMLDQERSKNASLEAFFREDREDGIFVKNLETVQGDERDVILLSIGYGPDTPGAMTMSMNFGPLNRNGGERRLNVAITRATTETVIFASFDPSMIDLTRTSAAAVRDLKHYLEFAQRGPSALGEAVLQTGGADTYDSEFEQAVAEGLRRKGWNVQTQIGVSKFRIDLGIVHPHKPGNYLAGIECDGAAYHSSPSARDRDRVRHSILTNLNWNILRIWSTDYFIDPVRTLGRIHVELEALLAEDQANDAKKIDLIPLPAQPVIDEIEHVEEVVHHPLEVQTGLEPKRFYDEDYLPVIKELAVQQIDAYGPMTFRYLCDRIARDHGFQRTGSGIKSQIWKAMHTSRPYLEGPDGQKVFWPEDATITSIIDFRGLHFDGREWRDIPYPEKLGLARKALASASNDLPALMASELGYARLTQLTRTEFVNLIEAVQTG